MFAFVRSVVMWLIALAIPVQGMAAVVTPLCLPAHHSDGSSMAHRLVGHRGVAAHAALAGDHAAHHGAASDHDTGAAHDHLTAPDETGHAGHAMLECCSAACAMSGVMPPSLAARASACSVAPPHAVAPLHLGVTPDGLDRPPKPIVA